jgi:hypothetical protein
MVAPHFRMNNGEPNTNRGRKGIRYAGAARMIASD